MNYEVREKQGVNFFEAIEALKQGKLIKSRIGFVYCMEEQGQI